MARSSYVVAGCFALSACGGVQTTLYYGVDVECGYVFELRGVNPGECWTLDFAEVGTDGVESITSCYPDTGGLAYVPEGSYDLTVWDGDLWQSWGPETIPCDPAVDDGWDFIRPLEIRLGVGGL